jgi:hypothetical protein
MVLTHGQMSSILSRRTQSILVSMPSTHPLARVANVGQSEGKPDDEC